jgi:MFS family permease
MSSNSIMDQIHREKNHRHHQVENSLTQPLINQIYIDELNYPPHTGSTTVINSSNRELNSKLSSDCSEFHWFNTSSIRFISWQLIACYFLINCALELPTTAILLILNSELNIQPAAINEIYALWYLPGTFRPLFALLSDQLPIIGYRRKSYITIAILFCIVWSILLFFPFFTPNQASFVGIGVLLYTASAAAETITDSMLVELGNLYAQKAIEKRGLDDKLSALSTSKAEVDLLPELDSHSDNLYVARAKARYDLTCAIKGRLQSEAMSVRCLSSVLCSGLSIGLMSFLPNRSLIAITIIFYLFTLYTVTHIKENKSKTGYLGLAGVIVKAKNNSNDSSSLIYNHGEISTIEAASGTIITGSMNECNASPILSAVLPIPSLTKRVFFYSKLLQLWFALKFLWKPLFFTFFYYSMPDFGDTYSSFLADDFSFTKWQYSLFNSINLAGSLLGALIFWKFLSHRPIRRVFITATILTALSNCSVLLLITGVSRSFLGVPDAVFVPVVGFINSLFISVSVMPPLVLAAQNAPKELGLEGCMFSLFQMAVHFGSLLAAVFSAQLTEALHINKENWTCLYLFVIICSICSLIPLPFAKFLLKESSDSTTPATTNSK